MTRRLVFVEIDIDYCANVYGTAPCAAAIGVTGDIKCFNTPRTCQDRDNFANVRSTLRFVMPTSDLPSLNGSGQSSVTNHSVTINSGSGAPQSQPSDVTVVDRTMALVNGAVITTIGLYSAVALTNAKVKVFKRNGVDNFDVVADSGAFSHPGGGWFDVSLSFMIPGSGTYYLGAHEPSGNLSVTASVPRSTANGDVVGPNKTITDSIGVAFPLRYTYEVARPRYIEAIPSIKDVSFTPATVSLGKDLGQRATLTVKFNDHPFADTGTGFDKYVSERGYDPYKQGSFWGKFRARNPYLRGRAIRLIQGEVGQALEDMETRHYVLDSFDGPSLTGEYSLIAKDALKLADGDRAQAPVANTGSLLNPITATATSATLTPVGVGNAEYPTSGYAAIGGNEICAFTRSGDALTLTRGQLGTAASAHQAEDRVQLVLRYTSEDAADILADLFQNYAGIPSSWIPIDDWRVETATYLGRLYSAVIGEPTSVATLASELIEQGALAVWWDDRQQKIRLQVLRGVTTDARVFSLSNILEGTLKTKDQPDTRLSRIQTYYGQINPLLRLTETSNFRSMAETADVQAEADYGSTAIKTVYSRWIPAFGRTVALRLNAIQLSRFRDPPRRINYSLLRGADQDINLGGGYRLTSPMIQDATGVQTDAPIQVTQLNPKADVIDVQAEEMLFNAPAEDLNDRTVTIDSNAFNLDLKSIHDQIYPPATSGVKVTFIVTAGITIGSTSTAAPAVTVGAWAAGVDLTLVVHGRIQGCGGLGGNANSGAGQPGGTALYTRQAMSLEIPDGKIWGGGGGGGAGGQGASGDGDGGGGGGGGGGGSGTLPGGPGSGGPQQTGSSGGRGAAGQSGTSEAGGPGGGGGGGAGGGAGGTGGTGGGPGLAGSPGNRGGSGEFSNWGPGGPGGAAGKAIDGLSFVAVTVGPGDIRGTQTN